MKLPEPVAWQHGIGGQVWRFKANKTDIALFTETQLIEALAQQEAAMRQALDAISDLCGYRKDIDEAINAIEECLK